MTDETLDQIVESLAKQAADQIERAYAILGARPGPGTDLLIYPVTPICGRWMVGGLTNAGRAFVDKFWAVQPITNNTEMARLKREADDWQLKYKIEYPVEPLED